jgi:hypothetical protein
MKAHELIGSLDRNSDDYKDCVQSQKFDLGNVDKIASLYELSTGDFCKLPYDVCLFEFAVGPTFVAILGRNYSDGFVLKLYCRVPGIVQWRDLHISCLVSESMGISFIDTLENISIKVPTEPHGRVNFKNMRHDYAEACSILYMTRYAIEVFSCSNVKTVEHAPGKFINAKRVKKGKLPFFSYHTLHISGEYDKSEPNGGTHASPRLHLRRGHIRKLANGSKVWVRQCLVGDKTKGIVGKDYSVH